MSEARGTCSGGLAGPPKLSLPGGVPGIGRRETVHRVGSGPVVLNRLVAAIGVTESATAADDEAPSGVVEASTPPTARQSVRSDETVVRDLVADHGGRMFQGDVVDATEFSAATVSRLLNDLEDDDRVVRYRKGKRKVVVLPELHPEVARYVTEDDG